MLWVAGERQDGSCLVRVVHPRADAEIPGGLLILTRASGVHGARDVIVRKYKYGERTKTDG